MTGLLPDIDPEGLLEYSVVFTDRSLNHMSKAFQGVMNDISSTLKEVYNADATVVVPGGGTFGMEAVVRQFAHNKKCLVVRNGWFSYRWTQIFEMGNIPSESIVMKARRVDAGAQAAFAPVPIDELVATILREKPDMVFAPHIETSAGMMLPKDYLQTLAAAVHSVGGLFVLDCIASGTIWLDMKDIGIDVLISAPQKGWSASPCAALVMLNNDAVAAMQSSTSSSFACNLKQWHSIMQAYENGGHAYHATLPTDALKKFRDAMLETKQYGFDKVRKEQIELGQKVRALLESRGIKSVAAEGFKAPSVVVNFTTDPDMQNGKKFAAHGMQAAAGVPLQCDEGPDYMSFRLGLFGLDKLHNVDRSVANLAAVLDEII